jgi:hypothetical protein
MPGFALARDLVCNAEYIILELYAITCILYYALVPYSHYSTYYCTTYLHYSALKLENFQFNRVSTCTVLAVKLPQLIGKNLTRNTTPSYGRVQLSEKAI